MRVDGGGARRKAGELYLPRKMVILHSFAIVHHKPLEHRSEKDLSTASQETYKRPRIQGADGNEERAQGFGPAKGKRTAAPYGERREIDWCAAVKPTRFSLKKSEILRGYKAFSRVIAEGQSVQRGAVRCFFLRDTFRGKSLRVGFSVSRGVRNADDRNRARRWMKETYRKNKTLLTSAPLPATEAVMVVFLCTANPGSVHNATARTPIEQSVVALLKELHSQFVGRP